MIFWISWYMLYHFSWIIMLVWVFSLFWLVWLRVCQYCLSLQRTNTLFHWFFVFFHLLFFFNFLLWHKNILTTFIYYSLCVVHKKKSGDNLWDLVLPSYYVGPKDHMQVIRLGSKSLPTEPSHQTWVLILWMLFLLLILNLAHSPTPPQALRCIIKLFIWIALILM